jgi:hypothetical protein
MAVKELSRQNTERGKAFFVFPASQRKAFFSLAKAQRSRWNSKGVNLGFIGVSARKI